MANRRIHELTSIYSTGFTIDSSTEIAIDRSDYTEAYKMNLNELIAYSSGGTSGTSGVDGLSGATGTSGTSGVDGTSGTSGVDGTSGTSGTSGVDGTSGTSGTSGVDGTSGTSGVDGTSGTSGVDGDTGTSGTSGVDGTSGTSGVDGTSGTSGVDGTSGTSGVDGPAGQSFTGATTDTDFYYVTSTDTLFNKNQTINNTYIYTDSLATTLTWLSSNMTGPTTIVLTSSAETFDSTLVIDYPNDIIITSGGYGQATLYPTASLVGSPLFDIRSSVGFDQIVMDATGVAAYGASNGSGEGHPGDDAIWVPSGSAPYVEFKDSAIYGFYSGIHIHGDETEFWVFEAVVNENVYGVWISGNTVRYRSMAVDYSYNQTYGIAIEAGSDIYFSSQVDSYELFTGTTALHVDRALTAVTFDTFIVQSALHNNLGSWSSDIDFSRADGRDADIEFVGCQNIEESRPHAKFNMTSNTGVTTITTQDVWYKAIFKNIPDSYYTAKWKIEGNKITYLPQKTDRDCIFRLYGSISTTNNPATTYNLAVVKNDLTGTTYGLTQVTTNGANVAQPFSVPVYLEDVTYNDYFSIYIRNTSGTADVTLVSLNAYVDSR